MITERDAVLMLEGEIPTGTIPDSDYSKKLYSSMQKFAENSLDLCESGKTEKFEAHLRLAFQLFREGNNTVKNSIVNVYLYSIAYVLDKRPDIMNSIRGFFPKGLMEDYHMLHFVGGL